MNKDDKTVSIIMAAYNAEKTIDLAIRSVLAQTWQRWELLIVDDCSTDQTSSIAELYTEMDSRIHLLKNEKNSGVSFSRKRGMNAAIGEWIAVLDSDDMWASEKLKKQFDVIMNENAVLSFTGSAFIDEVGNPIDWQLHVPKKLTYRKLLEQNIISNSSVLVRKELYRQYYAEGDEMHEDFAIWLGLLKDGYTVCGIDEPLLIYRVAKSSKSGNKLKAAKMNWNTYRYIGLNPITAFYFMCWYTLKGILKYRHLR